MSADLENQLSPKAKLWVERMGRKEGRHPGRVLSEIIERYCELEENLGEESVEKLVEKLVHGPKEIFDKLEKTLAELANLQEQMGNTNMIVRLYCAQLHAKRNMRKDGTPAYGIGKGEKELLFEPSPEDEEEEPLK